MKSQLIVSLSLLFTWFLCHFYVIAIFNWYLFIYLYYFLPFRPSFSSWVVMSLIPLFFFCQCKSTLLKTSPIVLLLQHLICSASLFLGNFISSLIHSNSYFIVYCWHFHNFLFIYTLLVLQSKKIINMVFIFRTLQTPGLLQSMSYNLMNAPHACNRMYTHDLWAIEV